VDASLAGQEVSCPECQHPLKIPARSRGSGSGAKTSYWALASAALALLGAFTILGSAVAVLLGVVALVLILRDRERSAGLGLALFGIIAGTLCTVLTLVALARVDFSGLNRWVRQRSLAGKIDLSGPLEIVTNDFVLVRPSEQWGRVKRNTSDDPEVGVLQERLDLLLANLDLRAFVDVSRDPNDTHLDRVQGRQPLDLARTQSGEAGDGEFDFEMGRPRLVVQVASLHRRDLPQRNKVLGREQLLEARRGRQLWRFLVRTYQRADDVEKTQDSVFIVRAYAPAPQFNAHEAELRACLDSFRLVKP
jgi:hypothetical protein